MLDRKNGKRILSVLALILCFAALIRYEQSADFVGAACLGQERIVKTNEDAWESQELPLSYIHIANPQTSYEHFLCGDEKLVFTAEGDTTRYLCFREALVEGEEYTLSEMMEAIRQYYLEKYYWNIHLSEFRYAYIDCGMDGVEELLISMAFSPGGDISTALLVIKEIDGSLRLCAAFDGWSRSAVEVNQYGYVYSSGSNGADSHGYDAGYIDQYGKWHYVVGENFESNCVSFWWNGKSISLQDSDAEKLEDLVVETFFFEKDDTQHTKYITYSVYGEDDPCIYEPGHRYRDAFESEGITVYTLQEARKMIAERMIQEGYDEQYASRDKEPVWREISYAAGGEYVVKAGDCLWSIAEEQLGDAYRYIEIYDDNRGVIGEDANVILPGMQLILRVEEETGTKQDAIRSGGSVEEIVDAYFDAFARGDVDAMREIARDKTETELLQSGFLSEYIADFENIECCVIRDEELSIRTLVFVKYDLRLKDMNILVPGYETFFVYEDTEKNPLWITMDIPEEDYVRLYEIMTSSAEFQELNKEVNRGYSEILDENPWLAEYLENMQEEVSAKVGAALSN